MPSRQLEYELHSQGYNAVAGVDEAGRGCWAGPVVAAACILPIEFMFDDLQTIQDSKKLSEAKREILYDKLTSHPSIEYAIAKVSAQEIDKCNILQATFKAMEEAVGQLQRVDHVCIDGNQAPSLEIPKQCIVKGDEKCLNIAAASILAKVSRDRYMRRLGTSHPRYLFERHKGYGTLAHRKAIETYGPLKGIHRMTFKPLSCFAESSAIEQPKDDPHMDIEGQAGRRAEPGDQDTSDFVDEHTSLESEV